MKSQHFIPTNERPLLVEALKQMLPKLENLSLTQADELFRKHPKEEVQKAYEKFVQKVQEVNQSRESGRFSDDFKKSQARGAVKLVAHQSALLYLLSFIRSHGYNTKTWRIEKNL